MEFLMSLFIILSLNLNQSVEQFAIIDSKPIVVNMEEIPGVTIVMMDDILYVNVETSSDLLDVVEIFDGNNSSVSRSENCNSSTWSVDLSALNSGDYDVEVLTTLANSYSAVITIN